MTTLHSNRGTRLAQLLLGAFESMVADVERELAQHGHAALTAANEFVLVAIDAGAESASELGRRLGVSRQAAAKTIAALEHAGYVERAPDPDDARRRLLRVTERGYEAHALGARLFDAARRRWAAELSDRRVAELEDILNHISELPRP